MVFVLSQEMGRVIRSLGQIACTHLKDLVYLNTKNSVSLYKCRFFMKNQNFWKLLLFRKISIIVSTAKNLKQKRAFVGCMLGKAYMILINELLDLCRTLEAREKLDGYFGWWVFRGACLNITHVACTGCAQSAKATPSGWHFIRQHFCLPALKNKRLFYFNTVQGRITANFYRNGTRIYNWL